MSKEKVAVVVDSTGNIPDELVAQYGLHVVPLIINWEGKSYHDGVDIQTDEFYKRLATAETLPTTSQPSAGEFYEVFTALSKTAESILCITISPELSGTLASAQAGAEMMGDFPIEVVDSRFVSMGLGFIALAAARAVQDGADYKEAAQVARATSERMNLFFVVDTLEYLHRGGRIGGAQRLIGSVLSIKPVLHVDDGRIEPFASVRTKRKAVKHMITAAEKEMAGKSNIHVAVLSAAAPDEAQAIAAEVQASLNPAELLDCEISPVLGTHVGPGSVGIACYAES